MKKTLKLTTFLLAALFTQYAFSSGTKPSPKEVEWTTKVNTAEAKKMFDEGVLFIDNRRDQYFQEGHIPNAIGISTKERLSEEVLLKIMEKDTKAVFYCHGEFCPASSVALQRAARWGFSNLYYFRMGIGGWKEAGHPIHKPKNTGC